MNGQTKRKRVDTKPNPGWWKPGQSGNPSGRPKKGPEMKHLEQLCRENAEVAFGYLMDLIEDLDAPKQVRLQAAREILDRGFGRPVDRTAIMALPMGGTDEPDRMTDEELLRVAAGGAIDISPHTQVLEFKPKVVRNEDEGTPP